MTIKTFDMQVGASLTPSENFTVTPVSPAGSLAIQRGNPGSPISTPLLINPDDSINLFQQNVNLQPSFRNKLINGMMGFVQYTQTVDTAVSLGGGYVFDGWKIACSSNAAIKTQSFLGGPYTNFPNLPYVLQTTTQAAFTPAAGDFFMMYQPVEGVRMRDFNLGTPGAMPLTVSFLFAGPPGVYSVSLRNGPATISCVKTITVTDTAVHRYVVSFVASTGGSWDVGSAIGVALAVTLFSGTTYQTPNNGIWTAGNFLALPTQSPNSFVSGSSYYLTGVQLESGPQASPFEFRDPVVEFLMAQRYYQIAKFKGTGTTYTPNGDTRAPVFMLPVSMRATPVVTPSSITFNVLGSGDAASVVNVDITGVIVPNVSYITLGQLTAFANLAPCGQVCTWGDPAVRNLVLDARL